jgi:hypothetical protein
VRVIGASVDLVEVAQ